MPTYEYRCRDCGRDLEVHQDFSAPALTECPTCGGLLRKRYGSVGVTFNGAGFYRTDSRSGDGDTAKAAPESKKPGAETASKPATPSPAPAAPSASPTT